MGGTRVTVDSSQSSSLVAVYLTCGSLRTGASPLAVLRWHPSQPGERNRVIEKGVWGIFGVWPHLSVCWALGWICTFTE
ncbi:hypothetical protein [Mycobacterium leprae]|nr:hypothetical protein [Mycobacterium leprae]